MKIGKELRSQAMSLNPRFDYLPESDRYYTRREPPKYKFNLIGAGLNGQEHIANTFLEGRAEIVGVYDPNPGSVAAAKTAVSQFSARQVAVYESLSDACQDSAVDGLIISTPNYTHLEVVKEAIKSGKHIFVEKPMATTVPDAFEMMQIASEYPAVFQIGLQYRFKAMYSEAIYEALTRRSIGDIKLISILEHRIPFLDKVNQWNKFSEFSGGTLVEKCCHYFDLFNLFAQSRPKTVYASAGQAVNFVEFEYNARKSDIFDHALVVIEYENGVRANFNLCMFAPMVYEELILCGDDGRIKGFEYESFHANGTSNTQLEVTLGEDKPSRLTIPTYPTAISKSGHHGSTFIEHVNFVDNIEGKPTDTATAEEGFWSIVIGAAAQASSERGQIVEIASFLEDIGVDI